MLFYFIPPPDSRNPAFIPISAAIPLPLQPLPSRYPS